MRKAFLPALSLLALTAITGCGTNIHDGVNMKKKVGFGAVVPNSGPYRQVGAEYFRGMKVAENSLNGTGGVESKEVKVLIYDSAGEPEKGLDATRRLTRDFEVPFMAVALPRVVEKSAAECNEHGTLVTRLEGGPESNPAIENSLRAFIAAKDEAKLMAETAGKEGWKKVLVLATDDRYGAEAAEVAVEELQKAGATQADRLPLRKEAAAIITIEDAVRTTKYAVCIFGHGPEIPPALLALRRGAHAGKVVGNHAFGGKTVTMLDAGMLTGLRFTAPAYFSGNERAMTARFRDEYRNLNRTEPDIFAALGYDQVMIVFTAAKAEESLSPKVVRKHIIADKSFDGAAGTYVFEDNGDAHLALTLEDVREAGAPVKPTGK
jgi:branched-chain amino acid transport system substrate-binding protein